jgi:DNA-binding transcriptional regulator YdaS (Cro superfamily)
MTLTEYLRSRKETHDAFARRLGVHSVTVSKWCSGSMRPSWPKMGAISRATDGAVTAADFLRSAEDAPPGAQAAPATTTEAA